MDMSEEPSAFSHQPSAKTSGTNRQDPGHGSRIAIVAAMEREVGPLVRGWRVREIGYDGRRYRVFEGQAAIVICGGIGAQAARRAAEAVIAEARPRRVISVGFAGALNSRLQVADVIEPRVVVNAADGSRADTGSGQGTLVSFGAVADAAQKKRLAAAYGADAVDMEAAAVAQAAQANGIEFAALKAISDVVDFAMPPADRFVSSDGSFRTVAFAVHIGMRPWLWGSTITLSRNSGRASHALCRAIENYLERAGLSLGSCVDSGRPRSL
jgi:adenosylhomocysteine nucleosidase